MPLSARHEPASQPQPRRCRPGWSLGLGLGPDDLAAYPLALGCSVRKNMVPVLDYLGKIGVRRDELPHLLHRYPQVLHASIVVDLAPVIEYLKWMEVKPGDVPRVLEGTMSTSVAYLVGIGVARRHAELLTSDLYSAGAAAKTPWRLAKPH